VDLAHRQPLMPLEPAFRLVGHHPEQIALLKSAALRILERTGVRVLSVRALDVFASGGAEVDEAAGIVRLPAELVGHALSTAPRSFVLGARDPALELELSTERTYSTTDGCGTAVVDRLTGERRASTKDDLAELTRLQDYLGSIGFWWPTVGAGDCGASAQLHEIEAGFLNTEKHLMGMVQGEALARAAVEMATLVAGGPERLRHRPVLSDLIGTVSPLVLDRDGADAALVFAEAGVPVCWVSMAGLGTTAPATVAGAYALGAAEVVAGAVLLQLASPGAPVIGAVMQVHADPRTGAMVTLPLDKRARFTATELLHVFGLPVLQGYAGTDARVGEGWLNGAETSLGLFGAALDRAELAATIGLIETYTVSTPDSLLLDDELYHHVRHALQDIGFGHDELALDVIDAVGPGGHFLATKHTREHMKHTFVRGLAHQPANGGGGYRDPAEVARERTQAILDGYRPPPLDADIAAGLRRIVAAADAAVSGA
jgi:trimethylamine--corrinoid protein Co-methyltransferase